MAEHRRVEQRSILGRGMTTDPERVREVEDEAARKERAWREHGDVSFGDVLKTAPARAAPDDETDADRRRDSGGAEPETRVEDGAAADPHATETAAKKKPPPRPTGPRAPPDPRAQALHKLLEKKAGSGARPAPVLPQTGETPPTGTVKGRGDSAKNAKKSKGPA